VLEFGFEGRLFRPGARTFTTDLTGLRRLTAAGRLHPMESQLRYIRYLVDFPLFPMTNRWADTGIATFAEEKLYVVQTYPKVIQRCLLMTTDPGDLVLDPTCGSGTTAYVAEQ
jgi:adenine-specific DNA-methyltransferase